MKWIAAMIVTIVPIIFVLIFAALNIQASFLTTTDSILVKRIRSVKYLH